MPPTIITCCGRARARSIMASDAEDAAASPAEGAFAFIDLARLGRTDWRSTGKGFLKIIGWQLLLVALGVGLSVAGDRFGLPVRLDDPFLQVALLALTTGAWFLGLRGAVVVSQGRPFVSLLSTDLRLDWRRVGLGGALWAASWIPIIVLASLVGLPDSVTTPDMTAPGPSAPAGHDLLVAALLTLPIFPFQAAAEELVFRGWLTQTIGQVVRRAWLVALIVAVLFAGGHMLAGGIVGFVVYVTMSLGFSALSLLDGRLELAIGLHAANNIFVVLIGTFVSPDAGQSLIHYPQTMPWSAAPAIVLQYATAFAVVWWLKRTDRAARA
jgi:membrane protease YdiL (CAAX protease family)